MSTKQETLNEIRFVSEAVVLLINSTALSPDLLAESVAPLLRALAVLGQDLVARGAPASVWEEARQKLLREITESALHTGMSEVLDADAAREGSVRDHARRRVVLHIAGEPTPTAAMAIASLVIVVDPLTHDVAIVKSPHCPNVSSVLALHRENIDLREAFDRLSAAAAKAVGMSEDTAETLDDIDLSGELTHLLGSSALLRDDLENLARQWVQEAHALGADEPVARGRQLRCATELRDRLRDEPSADIEGRPSAPGNEGGDSGSGGRDGGTGGRGGKVGGSSGHDDQG